MPRRAALIDLLEFLFEFRDDFEQVTHQPYIGNLENRCFRILVHRDDGARILDAVGTAP